MPTHVILNWRCRWQDAPSRPSSAAPTTVEADKLTVMAPAKANGAVVKLFKIVDGKLVPAGTKTLENGRATFKKADKNGTTTRSTSPRSCRPATPRRDRTNNHKFAELSQHHLRRGPGRPTSARGLTILHACRRGFRLVA